MERRPAALGACLEVLSCGLRPQGFRESLQPPHQRSATCLSLIGVALESLPPGRLSSESIPGFDPVGAQVSYVVPAALQHSSSMAFGKLRFVQVCVGHFHASLKAQHCAYLVP